MIDHDYTFEIRLHATVGARGATPREALQKICERYDGHIAEVEATVDSTSPALLFEIDDEAVDQEIFWIGKSTSSDSEQICERATLDEIGRAITKAIKRAKSGKLARELASFDYKEGYGNAQRDMEIEIRAVLREHAARGPRESPP